MKCPICGTEQLREPVCRVCGWDRSRDWAACPTVFPVAPEDLPVRAGLRREAERQLLCSRLGELLFSGLTEEELETCLAGAQPGEAARRLLLRRAPELTVSREGDRWRDNFLSSKPGAPLLPASSLPRVEIQFIRFRSSLAGLPGDAWDASAAGDGSVMAYVRPENGLYTLTLCGEGGVRAPLDCRGLFSGYRSLLAVDFAGAFHTSGCRNMRSLFEGCRSLRSLDLSGFDTWSVTDMNSMFGDCSALVSLELKGFRTDHAADMGFMFSNCSSLTALDVSGFDTRQTVNLGSMFSGCSALERLDVSRFRTEKVRNMSFMFFGCKSLRELDLRSFVLRPDCTDTGMLGSVGGVLRKPGGRKTR